jgi:Tfp pilus assembly protein PilO
MRKLSARERVLALICGITLVTVVLLQGVAIPLRSGLAEVNGKLKERNDLINRSHAITNDLCQMDLEMKALLKARQALLVSGAPMPAMIRRIEQASKQAAVGQVDIRPLGQERRQGYFHNSVQIEATANFPNLSYFLYYLEQGKNSLVVDRVEMNAENDTADSVRFTVLVSAYSLSSGGKK